jgi:hypothetical protein
VLLEESVVVAVSFYPMFQFAHDLFSLLLSCLNEDVTSEQMGWVISCLVHATVRPFPGVKYLLNFGKVNEGAPLCVQWGQDPLFSFDENVAQALDCVTAHILIAGWASLLLERRMLVVSSSPAVLPAVCELLLSLIAPLQWPHVYIPVLPSGLNATVESPCPYVIGAPGSVLEEVGVDWAGVTIINLDHGLVEVAGAECDICHLSDTLIHAYARNFADTIVFSWC